ncbi:sugar phosphate isomerase/epimerase [Collinsella sp. zg1085]|uniref:sugar phosphate isomerase/epimerase family protein n=1 Tax=Collinsella sp. zg1085 TaxID=2844380 RepID=UPI001C0B4E1B|nr:sugar phosphate isomerase/epimerase family protein [Collinsella sp. zg1085]QWT18062.1 sugar phosphate isomerase/epimerase [Collinsella sp. zg1085]
MQFGLLSAILDGWTFEESVELASSIGFTTMELAAWPKGTAERRYAGVSHIDVKRVLYDTEYVAYMQETLAKNKMSISSLAYYPNPLDRQLEKRQAALEHLELVIQASAKLGIGLVTTFIGRDQFGTVEENLALVKTVWPHLLDCAKDADVKIGIENCPMLFGPEQWPGGQNIMSTPALWHKVFDILDSDYLGLNFDPSHFVWQQLDYVGAVYEFADKLFHIHLKDIKLRRDKLSRVGTMAYPLDYMLPKIPGLGDVNWGHFISALTDVAYTGPVVLEVEDKSFEGSKERVIDSIKQSYRYLSPFIS